MRLNRINTETELLIGIVGASQALYLSLQTFITRNRNYKSNLLGLLFLSVTIRIVKSLLWVYLDTMPNWLINIGFIAHSFCGPLLFLYVYYFIFDKKWNFFSYLHFLPSFLLIFFIFNLTLNNFWYLGGYTFLLIHQMGYSLMGLALVFVGLQKRKTDKIVMNIHEWIWVSVLVIGTLVLQAAYFSNYVLGLTPYLLGPMVYMVFVYFLSFFAFKNPHIFRMIKESRKYSNIKLTKNELSQYKHKIHKLMAYERPYLDCNFNLKQLADKTKMPPYLVSHIVNSEFSQNFPDFINFYRINWAKELLLNDDYKNHKISSIAYDCGFNSLSSFNVFFKKITGMTPSHYKRKMMDL